MTESERESKKERKQWENQRVVDEGGVTCMSHLKGRKKDGSVSV
jgi:hypothetical protein